MNRMGHEFDALMIAITIVYLILAAMWIAWK